MREIFLGKIRKQGRVTIPEAVVITMKLKEGETVRVTIEQVG